MDNIHSAPSHSWYYFPPNTKNFLKRKFILIAYRWQQQSLVSISCLNSSKTICKVLTLKKKTSVIVRGSQVNSCNNISKINVHLSPQIFHILSYVNLHNNLEITDLSIMKLIRQLNPLCPWTVLGNFNHAFHTQQQGFTESARSPCVINTWVFAVICNDTAPPRPNINDQCF